MSLLNENTKVTLSLVIVLVGGIVWLSKINYTADAAATSLEKVLDKQEAYTRDIADIRKDIAVIKNILENQKESRR